MKPKYDDYVASASIGHPYTEGIVLSAFTPFSVPSTSLSRTLSSGKGACARLPIGLPQRKVEFRILKAFAPFTLSAALQVEYVDPGTNTRKLALLKLFDRRFQVNLRWYENIAQWDLNSESAYRGCVRDGVASARFLASKARDEAGTCLEVDHDYEAVCNIKNGNTRTAISGEESSWQQSEHTNAAAANVQWRDDPREAERYLQFRSLTDFATELRAYELFAHLQGHAIPKLLGTMCTNRIDNAPALDYLAGNDEHTRSSTDTLETPNSVDQDHSSLLLTIPGILLEFLEGSFTLSDIANRAPRSDWAEIVDLTTHAACQVEQTAFLNKDARPDNVLVLRTAKDSSVGPSKPLSLLRCLSMKITNAFCHCILRRRPAILESALTDTESGTEYRTCIIDFGEGEFRRCIDDYSWLITRGINSWEESYAMTMGTELGREHQHEIPLPDDNEAYGIADRLDDIGKRELMDLQRADAEEEQELPFKLPGDNARRDERHVVFRVNVGH